MSDNNGSKPDVQALRAEIKQTRAELGETVQALAAKADVKARAKDQVEQTRQRVLAQAAEATGKVREAAQAAGDRVRLAASQAGASARDGATGAQEKAYEATGRVRRDPMSFAAVFAGVVVVVGVILIVRGRRR